MAVSCSIRGRRLGRAVLARAHRAAEPRGRVLLQVAGEAEVDEHRLLSSRARGEQHVARFDVAVLFEHLNVWCEPLYCTKLASKIARTYTDKHSLKDLCRELLGKDLSKTQQSSDWGAEALSAEQQAYAAHDVLYLHELREKLDFMLAREGRRELASGCFSFLRSRAKLDLAGWGSGDIFSH